VCGVQCLARSDCIGYNWVSADGDYKNTCWLKNDLSDKREVAGITAGVKKCEKENEGDDEEEEEEKEMFCMWVTEENVAFSGGDLVNGSKNKVKKANKCLLQCEANEDCIGYSYIPIGKKGKKGTCWLKSDVSQKEEEEGATSGYYKCVPVDDEEEEVKSEVMEPVEAVMSNYASWGPPSKAIDGNYMSLTQTTDTQVGVPSPPQSYFISS